MKRCGRFGCTTRRLRRLPQLEGRLTAVSGASDVGRGPVAASIAAPVEDVAQVYEALVLGTRDYVQKTGFENVIIALSGGIDSTITAVLAVEALGAEQVRGVSMPSRYSSEGSVSDARALAENLGIQLDILPIEDSMQAMLGALAPLFEGLDPDVTEENLQARIRGVLMMALSNKLGALVLTTSNKSESATGYTTLYGDMTGGLAVIQDVPKLLVYELSRYANERAGREVVPISVLEKPPSAELRPDQFDEQSLMPYERLDPILQAFVEEDRSLEEIAAAGFAEADVKRVMSLVTGAEYKRRRRRRGCGLRRARSAGTGASRSPTATAGSEPSCPPTRRGLWLRIGGSVRSGLGRGCGGGTRAFGALRWVVTMRRVRRGRRRCCRLWCFRTPGWTRGGFPPTTARRMWWIG